MLYKILCEQDTDVEMVDADSKSEKKAVIDLFCFVDCIFSLPKIFVVF